jgi:hypothetical protein
MVIGWRRQGQRLGDRARQIIVPVALVAIIVATVTSGATATVAVVAPAVLFHTILFMKLSDNPTIVSIVGVTLVEYAVSASSAHVVLGAVSAVVLLLRLHREESSLLALGVLRLDLGGGASGRLCMKTLPSSALAHLSAISKSLTTEVSSSFMDNFSFILMSVTPVEKAEMTSSLEIRGILFRI